VAVQLIWAAAATGCTQMLSVTSLRWVDCRRLAQHFVNNLWAMASTGPFYSITVRRWTALAQCHGTRQQPHRPSEAACETAANSKLAFGTADALAGMQQYLH